MNALSLFDMTDRLFSRGGLVANTAETDSGYLVELELPGIGRDNISISTERGYLLVTATRKEPDSSAGYRYVESEFGKFRRVFKLPSGVDLETIDAEYKDGVLRISIQKSESTKPRSISIR